MHHPTDRIAHTTAFVTPVVEHWLEWEIAQWVHPMKDWSRVLFNDALDTFYLRLYGIGRMVGDLLRSPHGLLFLISSKGSFIWTDRTAHTRCGALGGKRNSSMGPPWGINLTTHHTKSGQTLYHGATSHCLVCNEDTFGNICTFKTHSQI